MEHINAFPDNKRTNIEILNSYLGNIYNLGDLDATLEGCYSTLDNQSEVVTFIHEQFTKNADSYSKIYTNYDYFEWLIKNCLEKINIRKDVPIKILDIGSGSGNTIIPLIKIFPRLDIIGSDLSLELLYKLKQNIDEQEIKSKIVLLQLNAEKLNFSNNSFDLVVGGAILHHLFHPEKTIEGCLNILKNDGHAFFFEPFEEGNMILCYIYEMILNDKKCELDRRTEIFLQSMINDYKIRKGSDKEKEIFSKIDDKWLFTKTYFYELSDRLGFSKCVIYPIHESIHQFEKQTLTNLRFIDPHPEKLLSASTWDKIRSFDEYFSEEFKKELIIEGCVIFKK
jgi:ubiquinone/menaquinone biosynthesis C-methylase UbiE